MKHVDVEGHTLAIDANGVGTPAHPDNDISECGFEEYIELGWGAMSKMFPSTTWSFTRHTHDVSGQVYWNGTPLS